LLVALRPLGLGDLLTGIPALRALARAFPDHRRVLAAPEALRGLAMLSGALDDLVPSQPLQPLDAALEGPAVAVDLHGRGPASHRVLLAVQPGRLLAFENAEIPQSRGLPRWCRDEHEVQRWCRMLTELGVPADASDLELPVPRVSVPGHARGATLIHPGAASEARRWPLERWVQVARAELARGRRVILTGSADEARSAKKIAAAAGIDDSCSFAGRTDLLELAALVANAGRVVCGDTGVGHLATAYAIPSVLLFGPTSPARWGPPRERAHLHHVLWRGATGDPHAARCDAGLLEIGAAEVIAALDRLPRAVSQDGGSGAWPYAPALSAVRPALQCASDG
jgi:ADP-heptose:LPS heptosyltransferase